MNGNIIIMKWYWLMKNIRIMCNINDEETIDIINDIIIND